MTRREARVAVSMCAAIVGVLICVHQRHFVLVPWVWQSWVTMLGHRCGRVCAASVLWALVESGSLLAARAGRPREPLLS